MRRLSGEERGALAALLRPAGRRAAGRLLVPGYKCAEEYLRSGAAPDLVLLDAARAEEARDCLGPLRWRDAEAAGRLRALRPHELARLADQPSPEGLVLVGPSPPEGRPAPSGPPHLILDGVQDPGNLGAMLRTALWFGMERVWLAAPCADPWSPRGIRAAMGAVFHLRECRVVPEGDLPGLAAASGWRLVGLDAQGERPLDEHVFSPAEVLVLGSESHGLRLPPDGLWLTLRIPGAGRVESLNVGHAMAICAWHWWRRRAPA